LKIAGVGVGAFLLGCGGGYYTGLASAPKPVTLPKQYTISARYSIGCQHLTLTVFSSFSLHPPTHKSASKNYFEKLR